MLISKTKNNERIEANKVNRNYKKGDYICPQCGEPVFPKKGEIKISHFAHFPGERKNCEFWEPESEVHLAMKKIVENVFSSNKVKTKLEVNVGGPITDVLIISKTGEKIAVECQHSKITDGKIKERSERLKKYGCQVIWIFDIEKFPSKTNKWYYIDGKIHPPTTFFKPKERDQNSEYYILSKDKATELNLKPKENIFFSLSYYKKKLRKYQKIRRNRIIKMGSLLPRTNLETLNEEIEIMKKEKRKEKRRERSKLLPIPCQRVEIKDGWINVKNYDGEFKAMYSKSSYEFDRKNKMILTNDRKEVVDMARINKVED